MPPEPPQRRVPQRRSPPETISKRFDVGARIKAWVNEHPDMEKLRWRAISQDVFNLAPSNAVTQRLRRAYAEWLAHGKGGSRTTSAAGAEARNQRRRKPEEASAHGRHQGEWISFELAQWFVDEVESIKSRSDSRLMLDQARWIKAPLIASGTPKASLPKIKTRVGFSAGATSVASSCVGGPLTSR